MIIKKIAFLIFCCSLLQAYAWAQDAPLLTLKEAVEIALKNNYNIKLSQNNKTIAANNVTLGNAGVLPQVNGNFASTNSRLTTKQTRSTVRSIISTTLPTRVSIMVLPLTGQFLTVLTCLPHYDQLNSSTS
jgi:outer membrane protein TolC